MATAEKPPTKAPDQGSGPTPTAADPTVAQILAARRRRFTVEEYYKMAEAGILGEDERVELIDGEVLLKSDRDYIVNGEEITVSPIGSRHAACVDRINRLLLNGVGERAIVRNQGPFRLGNRTEPEPDLLVLKPVPDFYQSAHPGPADVLALFEVGYTSAESDRKVKLGLYARSGVPEVWLVDLTRDVIEVYRRPAGGVYAEKRELARGESVAPEAFPDVVLGVSAILG